ncbi:circadian clock-controlled protein-like [Spodoptera litura]|uniref:Circadian clock-controlled protein-like n=1 Tax=Spodoptera litura TaxID=69820 RepID=A0A9J7EGK1_SPOLT|nr:circadian clock-controlled protein-like [Spodoptera litura]
MWAKCYILLIGYFVTGSIAGGVSYIKPCKPRDSKCIVDSAKIALPHVVKGLPEFGTPSLDPLHINKEVKADTGDLKISFKNIVVRRLSECDIIKITRDPVKSTASILLICPLTIDAEYKAGGKLFYIDVYGNGPFNIKNGKIRISIDLKIKSFEDKKGVKHYKIGGFDYEFEPLERFDIKLDNLFNGDKTQADPINKIISESWKELILDVGKPVLKEGILTIVDACDKMFKGIAAEDLELPE